MNEKRIWLFRSGKASLVPVVSGNRTEDMVELLSGISVGDTVITSGLMQLRPGMAVRVNVTE
jgi:membrane fusion protein (multidrug efflux system)